MSRKAVLIVGLVLLLQLLLVPATLAAPPAPGYAPGSGGFWHRVSWGESLSTMGWTYGVNPYAICAANGLANCNYVYAGQMLWIPGGGGPGPVGPCAANHRVSWGQTLTGIANWYGVSIWHLARANGIYNLNRLYAGQTLCIPW